MLINPSKSSLNLKSVKKKTKITLSNKENAEIPFLNEVYSEKNFLDFQVKTRHETPLKLMTYRENGKNIQDLKRPKALLIRAHGVFSYQDFEASIAKQFSDYGITSVGFDYRGHGRSEGTSGLIDDFNDNVSDMIAFLSLIDQIYEKDIPRFYSGLSLGGAIGYMVGLRVPDYFKGMILLAPGMGLNNSVKPLIKIVKYCCCCISSLPINERKNQSTRSLSCYQKWINDPLVYHGRLKLRTLLSLDHQSTFCDKKNYNKFKVPFVVVIGGADKIVNVEACVDLYERSEIKDKTLLFVPDMWHAVQHEEELV